MEFVKQLSLTIQHEYFSQGIDSSLSICPSEECSRQLRNFNLLFKSENDGLTLLKRQDSETNVATDKPSKDMTFDFLVYLTDKRFYEYTALSDKKNEEVYLFSNQTADKKSTAKLVASTISSASISASLIEPLLGVIRLQFNAKLPAQLTLPFSAKAVKWRYYVVARASQANLVVDGTSSDISFSRKEVLKKSSDTIISALTDNYPTAAISSFESNNAVVLHNKALKNIQLKNEQNNTILIKHLPNPALQDNGVQIINLFD